jgi:predicted dehydrogenase
MKIAFVGVGGIAGNYRGSLKKLGREREVVGICDLNAERAQSVADEHGAQAFTDHTTMLREVKPDAVFISIPPGAHGDQVADAARAGAAVFVAKPVGMDWEQVRRTRDAVGESGVLNQVGYMARYSDICEKAQEIVGDRKLAMGLGRFMCRMGAHPWWGKNAVSGGQMLEQSTHVFDQLRLFMGEVDEVFAWGHKGLADDIADFEDATTASLKFKSGACGNIHSTCCTNVPDSFATELSGRDFYLKLSHDHHLVGKIDNEDIEFKGEEAGYFRQVEHFLKAVEANDQKLIRSDFADAAKTLAVTLAANASLASGQVEKVQS